VVMIKQILDVGAEGVIVPWVNTPEEAKRAVSAARYPPTGIRGYGPRRASRLSASPAEYVRRANDEILVIGQIETRTAMENLDGILSTPGLDAIMIGPADLAASLGHVQDLMNPAVDEAIGRVLAKCKEHRVPFGMFTGTLERTRQWVSQGGLIATVGGDVPFLLAAAAQAKQDIDALKAEIAGDK
jgi:2-keto-3-deoxy-L-rhamnonate aldolase RhmA